MPPWEFSDNHIEIGSHLFTQMPALMAKYPDAKWVHLIREREACCTSLASQCTIEVVEFCQRWFHIFRPDPLEAAKAYYDAVNGMIDKMMPPGMCISIENAVEHWIWFWDSIGAEGDLPASANEFERRYNATGARGVDNYK